MSEEAVPVIVEILGKEYRIACGENEREELLVAAEFLDERMREVRTSGRIVGQERIAVMTALNITHELIQSRDGSTPPSYDFTNRLAEIRKKVDTALDDS